MSTLRISNIEAKSVPASATIDEKEKITNSSGDTLVFIDGKTSGITTVGINTTDSNITFDANSNVVVTGIITATKFIGTIEPTNLTVSGQINVGSNIKLGNAGVVTATSFVGSGANLTSLPTQVTISNNADNRIITGGSGVNLTGESNFTYDGNEVAVYAQTDDTDCVLSLVGKTASGGVGQAGRTAIIAESSNNSNGQSKMHFRTRNTSNAQLIAMTIDGNQNVGIGTQSPQSAGLTVLRHSEARLQVWANGDGSNGKIALRADGTNTQMGTWSNHDCKLVRNNGIQASIISNGIQLPDGKSINFGNTIAAAHQLDDYEEGSYTPVMGGSGWSYSRQVGYYRKVGTLVHVSIWITGSGGPNDGSTTTVSLPFTSYSASSYRGGISGSWDSSNFDNTYTSGRNRSHLNSSTTTMQASFPFVDNGGWTSSGLVNSGLYNGFACQMSGSYISNS